MFDSVNNVKLLQFQIHEGSYNVVRFHSFKATILKNVAENNPCSFIFMMDNCSIHKSDVLKETLQSSGIEL